MRVQSIGQNSSKLVYELAANTTSFVNFPDVDNIVSHLLKKAINILYLKNMILRLKSFINPRAEEVKELKAINFLLYVWTKCKHDIGYGVIQGLIKVIRGLFSKDFIQRTTPSFSWTKRQQIVFLELEKSESSFIPRTQFAERIANKILGSTKMLLTEHN